MTTRSAKVALPIHFFSPSSTHSSPSRRAVVARPPAIPEPTSGSVSPKAPISSIRAIAGSQRSLLLVGAAQVDRAHRQAAVHAHERLHRRVDAGHLHRDHAVEQAAAAGAAGSVVLQAGDAELGEPGDQVVRELRAGPVVVDDRLDRRSS